MKNENILSNINFNNKLEIKYSNVRPIELSDLSLSLLSISHQYQKFIENETNDFYNSNAELFIKEVRAGSIIIELVSQTLQVAPLLWTGASLTEWTKQAISIFNWLLEQSHDPPVEISKQDLKQFNNIIEPVAKDHGSQLNFTTSDNANVTNIFIITSETANSLQNSIARKLEKMDAPEDHLQKKKAMFWYQTKFDDESDTGDKAVIESITKKPIKVIFENNAVKKSMLKDNPKFDRPWNELVYIVDVRVETIRDEPKVYTVINYYDDETFDPT